MYKNKKEMIISSFTFRKCLIDASWNYTGNTGNTPWITVANRQIGLGVEKKSFGLSVIM